jgi:hypothetical protein
VVIDAPATVISDTKFAVSVGAQAGAVATWTITNGFPATATGDNVTITAGSSGQVGITVRLTRGACADSLNRSIAITPKPACGNPKATVSATFSCGWAFLTASFTGTPPFKGMWADNVAFDTNSTSVVRSVTVPGNYSILRFQDSICEGTASGVAVVPALYPSAAIIGKANSCTGVDTATVFFTGKPPYSGCWLDGTCFQTNQTVLTKPITKVGWNTLASGSDGTGCSFEIFGGVQAFASPHVALFQRCEWTPDIGNYANFFVFYDSTTTGPSSITWSDGVKTGQARFSIKPSQTTTYTVVSMSEGVCPAIWDTPRSITVSPTPVPEFKPDNGDLCLGAIGTTTLAVPPPAGTTVHWDIGYGTILSGQGTNSIQYQAGDPTPTIQMYITCTFTSANPDRCPLITRTSRRVIHGNPYAALLFHEGNALQAGKTMLIQFAVGGDATGWSLTDSMNDSMVPSGPCIATDPGTCYWLYTSTHGGGQSTITLHVTNGCQTTDVSKVLTILP